ncbi:hypothetical protein AB1283_15100 [Bacillus sp. S13(2024)]|uniref:hypothetical protein n=1 Tax=unclassified Bacillus (in: firmicutes) TaxID=185979 RepID=UPI003D1C4049
MNKKRLGSPSHSKQYRIKEKKFAFEIADKLVKNPEFRRKFNELNYIPTAVHVYFEKDENQDVFVVKPDCPQQNKESELTIEKKLELLNKIAGSGRKFNPEHIEESLRIANRDEWE